MRCQISVDAHDQGTAHIFALVRPYLDPVSEAVSNDYGGDLENLWITLELCPGRADRRPEFPFRFQRRVSAKRNLKLAGLPADSTSHDDHNVGHFSVRPNYFELARVELARTPRYLLALVHERSAVLEAKRRSLRGFDGARFRRDLWHAICTLVPDPVPTSGAAT